MEGSQYITEASEVTAEAQAAARAAAGSAGPRRRRQKRKPPPLSSYASLPMHLQDNEHIKTGYRVNFLMRDTLSSLFKLHNETGNIWTHLIGFLLFVALTFATVRTRPEPFTLGTDAFRTLETRLFEYGADLVSLQPSRVLQYGRSNLSDLRNGLSSIENRILELGKSSLAGLEDGVASSLAALLDQQWPVRRWPIHVFTAGAQVCMLTSALCHLFGCCPAHIARVIWRFDYAAIAVLIVTSFYPAVYYAFLCQPHLRLFYLLTTTSLGLGTVAVSLMPLFQSTMYRPFRAKLFAALGLWGIVPIFHAFLLHWDVPAVVFACLWDVVMAILYLGGAVLYACRIPERYWPGRFDVWFHSHQIFHVAVILAALAHYHSVNLLLQWRDASGGCPPLS